VKYVPRMPVILSCMPVHLTSWTALHARFWPYRHIHSVVKDLSGVRHITLGFRNQYRDNVEHRLSLSTAPNGEHMASDNLFFIFIGITLVCWLSFILSGKWRQQIFFAALLMFVCGFILSLNSYIYTSGFGFIVCLIGFGSILGCFLRIAGSCGRLTAKTIAFCLILGGVLASFTIMNEQWVDRQNYDPAAPIEDSSIVSAWGWPFVFIVDISQHPKIKGWSGDRFLWKSFAMDWIIAFNIGLMIILLGKWICKRIKVQ
jgi:hypothetical protein